MSAEIGLLDSLSITEVRKGKGTVCFPCVRVLSLSNRGARDLSPTRSPSESRVAPRGLFCLMLGGWAST